MGRHRPTAARTRFTALALALTLSSCSGTADAPSGTRSPTSPQASARASPVVSPAASPTPSPTAGAAAESTTAPATPDPSAAPAADVMLTDRLLTAEQMPGFNEKWSWTVRSTRTREGARPFATCHRFAMTSIGATQVVVRRYDGARTADEDTSGSHLVATFADAKTARTAYDVLRSWRERCAEQLTGYERHDVGALQPVDVPAGAAGWYLLVYGPPAASRIPEEAYFDAQGIARIGRRVAVLQMRAIGQDYNYPLGEEPMVAGVRRAAAALR